MKSKRILASAFLSNSFEFFDYTLFAALTPVIQEVFFSGVVWITPYKLAIFAFCVSLVVRSLGGLLFGYIGDRFSRLLSLRLSIGCMTLASLILALLPGQKTIGDWAVWMVIFCRISQGMSAGGEYNGASIVAIESNEGSANLISGFMTASAMVGLALASIAAYFLSTGTLPDYAWRFFTGFGALIGIVSLFLRTVRHEEPKVGERGAKSGLWPFLAIFFIGGQTTACGYFIFVNAKSRLETAVPHMDSNLLMVASFALTAIVSVACGALYKNTKQSEAMLFGIKAMLFLSPLGLYLLANDTPYACLGGLTAMALLLGTHGTCQHSYFQSIVPLNLRQRVISLAFSLGAGVIGSAVVWLATTRPMAQTDAALSPDMFVFSLISACSLLCAKKIRRVEWG